MLKDYIVVDLEMTGLNPKRDHILEIGAVKVKDKEVQSTFSVLIRQETPLDERIVQLTGITDEMASAGGEMDAAVSSFLEFAEDFTWVGHNVMFDYSFVKQWEANHRIKRICYGVDTLKLTYAGATLENAFRIWKRKLWIFYVSIMQSQELQNIGHWKTHWQTGLCMRYWKRVLKNKSPGCL